MKLPTMVYRYPGSVIIEKVGFSVSIADAHPPEDGTSSDIAKLLEDGWYSTPKEALEATEAGEDDLRTKLEEKARNLGIKFRSDISDASLLAKINIAAENVEE